MKKSESVAPDGRTVSATNEPSSVPEPKNGGPSSSAISVDDGDTPEDVTHRLTPAGILRRVNSSGIWQKVG